MEALDSAEHQGPGLNVGGLDECEEVEEVAEDFEPAHIQSPIGHSETQDVYRDHSAEPPKGHSCTKKRYGIVNYYVVVFFDYAHPYIRANFNS